PARTSSPRSRHERTPCSHRRGALVSRARDVADRAAARRDRDRIALPRRDRGTQSGRTHRRSGRPAPPEQDSADPAAGIGHPRGGAGTAGCAMTIILVLIPLSIVLLTLAAAAFFWAV